MRLRVQLYWSESHVSLEWIQSFPYCLFTLDSDKDQREFSLQYNSTSSLLYFIPQNVLRVTMEAGLIAHCVLTIELSLTEVTQTSARFSVTSRRCKQMKNARSVVSTVKISPFIKAFRFVIGAKKSQKRKFSLHYTTLLEP